MQYIYKVWDETYFSRGAIEIRHVSPKRMPQLLMRECSEKLSNKYRSGMRWDSRFSGLYADCIEQMSCISSDRVAAILFKSVESLLTSYIGSLVAFCNRGNLVHVSLVCRISRLNSIFIESFREYVPLSSSIYSSNKRRFCLYPS